MGKIISIGPNPLNIEEEITFTSTIPDQLMYDTVYRICVELGYEFQIYNPQYNIEDPESQEYILNPEGPGTFVWRKTFEWWSSFYKSYEKRQEISNFLEIIDQNISEKQSQIIIGDENDS